MGAALFLIGQLLYQFSDKKWIIFSAYWAVSFILHPFDYAETVELVAALHSVQFLSLFDWTVANGTVSLLSVDNGNHLLLLFHFYPLLIFYISFKLAILTATKTTILKSVYFSNPVTFPTNINCTRRYGFIYNSFIYLYFLRLSIFCFRK